MSESASVARRKQDTKYGPLGRIVLFFRQVVDELRKVVWPTTGELWTYFSVVVVFIVALMAFTEILDLYLEAGSALNWTLLSPAPEFTDKPRTGTYTEGGDQPADSEISVADFAVALVDEVEKDAHRGHRWTIANT